MSIISRFLNAIKRDTALINAQKHFSAAKTHFDADRNGDAIIYLDQAFACGLKTAELFVMRGSCLQILEWHLDAIDDLSKAIELDPNDCNNFSMRANSHFAIGDVDGGTTDIREAIRLAKIDNEINRSYFRAVIAMNKNCSSLSEHYQQQAFVSRITAKNTVLNQHLAEKAKSRGRRPKSQF